MTATDTKNPMILFAMAKIIAFTSLGYSIEQIQKIREMEFSHNNKTGLTTNVEVWSNTKRTKGYKNITLSPEIQKQVGSYLQQLYRLMK